MRTSILLLLAGLAILSAGCNQFMAQQNPSAYNCSPADQWGSTSWCDMIDHPKGEIAPGPNTTTTGGTGTTN